MRPELEVEQRANGGITVKSKPIPNTMLLWNVTDAWLLRNNEFVRYGEALPAGAAEFRSVADNAAVLLIDHQAGLAAKLRAG